MIYIFFSVISCSNNIFLYDALFLLFEPSKMPCPIDLICECITVNTISFMWNGFATCESWVQSLGPFNLRCFHFSKHLIIHLTGYYCFVLFFICLPLNEIIFLEHILRCQFDLDGVSLSMVVTFHLLLKESFSKSSPNVSYSFIRAQHRWSSKDTSPLSRSTHAVSELWPALPFSDCSEACAEWEHNIMHSQHMWKGQNSSHFLTYKDNIWSWNQFYSCRQSKRACDHIRHLQRDQLMYIGSKTLRIH